MVTEAQLMDLKRRYSLRLMNLERVSGVGIEKDESGRLVLAIHLNDSSPETLDLPAELKDVPIKYHRQDGGFRKQTTTGRK
jgi:hypothetical protein